MGIFKFSRFLGILAICLFGLACKLQEQKETPLEPCTRWDTFEVEQEHESCRVFCGSPCAPDLPACVTRCNYAMDSARRIEAEIGTACYDATVDYVRCLSSATCSAELSAPECMAEFEVTVDACQGATPIFPGYRTCHEHCDAVACSCEPRAYLTWGDCYGQCRANLGLDLAEGCFREGVAVRTCISNLETCEQYEEFEKQNEAAECVEESIEWQQACQT